MLIDTREKVELLIFYFGTNFLITKQNQNFYQETVESRVENCNQEMHGWGTLFYFKLLYISRTYEVTERKQRLVLQKQRKERSRKLQPRLQI